MVTDSRTFGNCKTGHLVTINRTFGNCKTEKTHGKIVLLQFSTRFSTRFYTEFST
nr:MAG TPA: hypothetical protein [Caudoviricetes sp.]DAS63125.1 MAG TPA: hypothetical protein [Caudoviricetes sp.]